MARRVWLSTNPATGRPRVQRTEPLTLTIRTLGARKAGGGAAFDGVWINGERAYDTWVILNGVVTHHAPERRLSEASFAVHERFGHGSSLL